MLVALRRSGKWERRVIEEQLADEMGGAVTPRNMPPSRATGFFARAAWKGSIAGVSGPRERSA